MKKIILLLFSFIPLFFFAYSFAASAYAQSLDLTDKSSSGNNLTNINSVADSSDVPFPSPNTDSALFTASSSQYLKTASSPTNLNTRTSLTIEAWIKVTTISVGNMTIASHWGDSAGTLQWSFQVNRNTGGKLSFLYSTDGSNATSVADSTGTVTANAWHHVAFAWDGANYTYYIDGSPAGSGSLSVTLFNLSSQTFSIGAQSLPNSFFNGNIDEVRIWNVKRSAAQISAKYNTQLVGNEPGLVGYYPFNAIPNPTPTPMPYTHDKTSNGNNLTDYGASDITSPLAPIAGNADAAGLVASSFQYLTAPNSSSLQITGDITFESWIYLNTVGTTQVIVAKDSALAGQSSYIFRVDPSNKVRLYLTSDGNNYVGIGSGGNTSIPLHTWTHVGVKWKASNGSFTYYLNGSPDGTGTQTTQGNNISAGNAELDLGERQNIEFFDGYLDEVRLWSINVSDANMLANYNQRLTGSETGLVAYYPFEAIPAVTYYTANNGTTFSRSTAPFSSGVATQTKNSDESITVSINNTSGYADSGFVLYEGTLGNLPNFTVNGTGNQYSLNLWFDVNNDNEYFTWLANVYIGLGGDTYGLGPSSSSGTDTITGSSLFYLISDGHNHSLSDLKNGLVNGISSSTKVAVWIGVNTSSGSISSTITSITGL